MDLEVADDAIIPFLHGILEGMGSKKNAVLPEAPLPSLLDNTKDFAACIRLESQVDSIIRSHAELITRVDCIVKDVNNIAEDTKRLKTHAEKDRGIVEWLTLQETAISDIRKLHNGLQDRHESKLSDMNTVLQKLTDITKKQACNHQAEVEELHIEIARLQANLDECCGALERLQNGALEQLTGARHEVADLVGSAQQLENRLLVWRCAISSEIAAAFKEELNTGVQYLKHELRNAVDESAADVLKLVEEAKSDASNDVRKLRGEIKDALNNEANIIAALDEQLWKTDQRLSQRIDEAFRFHCGCKPLTTSKLGESLRHT